MTATGRFVWLAGPDRVGHAAMVDDRKVRRTACGLPVDESLVHPPRGRCETCLVALGFLPDLDDIEPRRTSEGHTPLSDPAKAAGLISNQEVTDGA